MSRVSIGRLLPAMLLFAGASAWGAGAFFNIVSEDPQARCRIRERRAGTAPPNEQDYTTPKHAGR